MAKNKASAPDEKKGKEVAVVPTKTTEISAYEQQRQSVETMITQAIQAGMPVETMKEILAMRRDLKAEWAKEQFDQAMANFQAACPVIEKTKMAKDETKGKDLYAYAPLDVILNAKDDEGTRVKELLARFGLSYSFRTENTPDRIKVTCIAKHVAGHSEESIMETALGSGTSIMSAPQKTAATVTFNKRYAFQNAFGIITGDEDNEQNLIEQDEAFGDLVEESKAKLAACKNAEELKAVWSALPKSIKGNQDVLVYANQLKKAYEHPQNGATQS